MPQGREIFPRLTVEENILLGLSRFSGSQSQIVPEHIYQLFPVLQEMKHRRGGDLSGGQQQQLAIGRALACQPRLLILDEPTEGIQPSVIKEISLVINTLAAKGDMAILLVEQFYDFAAELADSYLVMSRGKIVQRGHGTDMAFEGSVAWSLFELFYDSLALSIGSESEVPHSAQEPSYSATDGALTAANPRATTAAVTPEPQLVIMGLVKSTPWAAKIASSSCGDFRLPFSTILPKAH